ncbi:MAG: hypothetical protein N0A16_00545 [Blastocatellia bacterium]|nr:hypothetical protein [Blastocatellia bacterium]MCS7156200.1 hypothetical protein [Blastocatellia bacterium]MCX7751450.1 hypothetical protein [Blastocatellia bacterium]MDW8169163.1 hypothetical protein [Acidobacteriota bacterium]MDW8256024.1 hypothetical protein [Acidobacteriota bacterium]
MRVPNGEADSGIALSASRFTPRARRWAVLALLISLFGLTAGESRAQESAAQPAQEGLRLGRMIAQSELEFGWRQLFLGGNRDLYRSQINLGEGARLLGLSFTSRYPENTGSLFDLLTYTMTSWGGDPYNVASLRVEKRGLYRFDFGYSRIVYYNFLPTFANPLLGRGEQLGQHSMNTARRRSEYRLTLFPDADFRIRLEYERNAQFGSAFTTFPTDLDEFVLLDPPRTTTDDYRVGVDFRLGRLHFTVEQGFRAFKDDIHTTQPEGTINLGNSRNPANPTSTNPQQIFLQTFARDSGIRGFVPTTRLGLHGHLHRTLLLSGRFAYSDASVDFTRQERATGNLFDLSVLRYVTAQTSTSLAHASRPNALADASVNYRPHRRLTFTNTARFQHFTIAGDVRTRTEQQLGSNLRGALPSPLTRSVAEWFGARTSVDSFSNYVEGAVELTPRIVLRAGHRFAHRRVSFHRPEADEREESELNAHAVLGGLSLRVSPAFRLFTQIERGSSDNVFTRVAPRRLTRLRTRAQYRPLSSLTFSLQLLVTDARNPNPLVDNVHRNRGLTLTTLWTPNERFALSLTYTRADITSAILVLHPRLRTIESSQYVANDNFVDGDLMVSPLRNLRLALGYSIVNAQGTLPLNFHQPRGMIAYTFPKRFTWSVGWRWYGYNQKGFALEDYRAHTLTGSLKIAF